MAKPGIDGAERRKCHFFTSQFFQTGFISRNKNSPTTQVMNTDELPHDISGEPQDTKKESPPTLKGLFTRKKPEIATESEEKSLSTRIPPDTKDVSPKSGGRTSFPRSMSLRGNFSSKDLSEQALPTQTSMNRSLWNQAKSPTVKPSPKDFSTKLSKRLPGDAVIWEPPPLFQAYPQALKYSHLPALSLSTDVILRMDSSRKASLARGDDKTEQGHKDIQEPTVYCEKLVNSSLSCRHRRHPSNNFARDEWVEKVFVLLDTGYFLQYSGSGTYDRLPERTMRLGKDSVAFASDVIPGKHWVLQVSQSMNPDGVPTADSRSFFSRLTNRAYENKKSATSFLLVLKSAEDLESWITTLRIEISRLRGDKVGGEPARQKGVDKPLPPIRKQKSPMQDCTNIFQYRRQPTEKDLGVKNNIELQSSLEDCNPILLRRQRTPVQELTTDYHSMTNSIISQDGNRLESLNGSRTRFSYISSSQRTVLTSQCSSPNVSPKLAACDDLHHAPINNDSRSRPISAVKTERRISSQSAESPELHPQDLKNNFRQNSYSDATPSSSLSPPKSKFVEKSSVRTPTTRPHSYIDISPQTAIFKFNSYNDSRNITPGMTNDIGVDRREKKQFDSSTHRAVTKNSSSLRDNSPLSANKGSERNSKVDACRVGSRVGIEYPTDSITNKHSVDDKDIIIIKPSHKINNRTLSNDFKLRRVSSPGAAINSNHIADQLVSQPYSNFPLSNHVYSSSSYYSKVPLPTNMRLPLNYNSSPKNPRSLSSTEIDSTRIKPRYADQIKKSPNPNSDVKTRSSQVSRDIHTCPQHRRSLPSLVNGPPPLPPPNCALPPLPPAGFTKKSKIGFKIMRGPNRSGSDAYNRETNKKDTLY
ncbi:hypothetical protein K3495_g8316 [Podosphaera aphanis]|nr:hypothetical protein K3495_g8316 [Podosphaera aphanis]